jgi:hypothetical protein
MARPTVRQRDRDLAVDFLAGGNRALKRTPGYSQRGNGFTNATLGRKIHRMGPRPVSSHNTCAATTGQHSNTPSTNSVITLSSSASSPERSVDEAHAR